MPSPPWLSYARAHAHEAEARRLGVSAVARAPRGFMREYERAGGAAAMRARPLPPGVVGGPTWGAKRDAFVARHLAQYRAHPTPRRRLALLMWAYDPDGDASRRASRPRSRASQPRSRAASPTSRRRSRRQ